MKVDGRDSRTPRQLTRPGMSVAEAFMVLGLPFGAEQSAVHAAYRRLALKYHPDRNAGDPHSLERFKELSAAYGIIQRKFRLDSTRPDQLHDECDRCGEYAAVHKGLDGAMCCATCLSVANRRPLLPAPSITIVTCASTIVLLALAGGSLVAGWLSGSGAYLGTSLVLGLLSLITLGITCATVIYTADPKQLTRRRSIQTIRHRARTHSPERAESLS